MDNILQFPIPNLQRCNRFFVSTYGKLLLMHSKRKEIYDEGTSFPSGSLQVQTLYRDPDYCLTSVPEASGSIFEVVYGNNTIGRGAFAGTNNNRQVITLGQNTADYSMQLVYTSNSITFQTLVKPKQWVWLYFWSGYLNGSAWVSNFKLVFANGEELTIEQAIDQGKLSPLTLISSNVQGFQNYLNLYSGLQTDTVSSTASIAVYTAILFKPLKSDIVGVKFTSNKNWETTASGVCAYLLGSEYQFSLSPIK
jgi:hypothetical protein